MQLGDQVERDILPKFTPQRTAEITGLAVADIEKLAAMYGKAKAAVIRLGEGMTRLAAGGQALRAVTLLPGVTGHYGVRGGGALLSTSQAILYEVFPPEEYGQAMAIFGVGVMVGPTLGPTLG